MPADTSRDPATSLLNPSSTEPTAGVSLYKAATLLAMLLFLLSFWSC